MTFGLLELGYRKGKRQKDPTDIKVKSRENTGKRQLNEHENFREMCCY